MQENENNPLEESSKENTEETEITEDVSESEAELLPDQGEILPDGSDGSVDVSEDEEIDGDGDDGEFEEKPQRKVSLFSFLIPHPTPKTPVAEA